MNTRWFVALALIFAAPFAQAAPVLLISIDGLRPGDLLQADRRGLKLPNLRKMLAEGAHARGVIGVVTDRNLPEPHDAADRR